MTPKEKALRLCQDFAYLGMDSEQTNYYTLDLELAKRCALIAVDEILNISCPDTFACKYYDGDFYSDQDYFIAVKREIEKL